MRHCCGHVPGAAHVNWYSSKQATCARQQFARTGWRFRRISHLSDSVLQTDQTHRGTVNSRQFASGVAASTFFGILPLLRWSFDRLCVRSTPAEASLLTTQTRCGLRRSHVFLSSPDTAHILHCQNVIRKLKKKLAECCEFDPYVHFNKSRINPLSICLFACREEALDLSSPPPDLQRDLLRQMVKAKHQGV